MDARTISVATACGGWLADVVGHVARGQDVTPGLWAALPAALTAVLACFAGEVRVGRHRASQKGA